MQSQPHYYLALHPHNLPLLHVTLKASKTRVSAPGGSGRAVQSGPARAGGCVRASPHCFICVVNNGSFSSSPAVSKQTSLSILFMLLLLPPTLPHLPYNGFNSPGQARHGEQWPHRVASSSTVGVFFCALMNSTGVRSRELLGGGGVWQRLWTEPGAAHLDRQVLPCHPEQTQARSRD